MPPCEPPGSATSPTTPIIGRRFSGEVPESLTVSVVVPVRPPGGPHPKSCAG